MPSPANADDLRLPRFAVRSKPWPRELVENFRELFLASKVGPGHCSRQLAPMSVNWSRSEGLRRAQMLSLAMHSLLAAALILPIFRSAGNPPRLRPTLLFPDKLTFPGVSSLVLKPGHRPTRGGGSGGEENPVPATRGKIPPFAPMQITPPMPPRNPNPKLTAEATVLGPPEIRVPNLPDINFGIPQAALTGSAGPGHRGGFGNQCCGGVGEGGNGRGVGEGWRWGIGGEGTPGGWTAGMTRPECAYCPDPSYSEEARKAKYQGTVVLRLVVTADGRAANIRVIKTPGLGLEEKAIEAVRTWRFKPALAPSGKPVATQVDIEVTFRLL